MDNSTNLQIVQTLFQYYGQANVPGFMSLLSPDVVWVEPGDADIIPYSGTFTGMAGIGQMLGIVAKSVKMKVFTVTGFCTNDDTVTALGYNEAEVLTTGRSYSGNWVYAFKLSGGKVTHVEVYMDTLTMSRAFVH